MKFLIVSQVYWPDTASVAQHVSEIAEFMTENNHQIDVLTSRYNYEDKCINYPKNETYKKIKIKRLTHSKFGKKSTLGRMIDFLSFNLIVSLYLLRIKKRSYDGILGLTTPPLLPFICILFSKLKKIPYIYWAMDLQPELAINSGLVKKDSLQAKILSKIGNYTFRHADRIIALDHHMKDYIKSKKLLKTDIEVIPVWPVLMKSYDGKRNENPFRIQNGFGNKIVIMYSGNHSFVHPLDTLLDCAESLKNNSDFLFVFVGEGTQKSKVTEFKKNRKCSNIIQLPYEPKENIHISLSSADFQVVVMGNNNSGYTHPNKIYGAMLAGSTIIYIGEKKSFIYDILKKVPGNIYIEHGESKILSQKLLAYSFSKDELLQQAEKNKLFANKEFDPFILKEKMCNFIIS